MNRKLLWGVLLQNLPAMRHDFAGPLGTMEQNVGIFSRVPATTSR